MTLRVSEGINSLQSHQVEPLPQTSSPSCSVTLERYLPDKRSPVSQANALTQGRQEHSFMWLRFAF